MLPITLRLSVSAVPVRALTLAAQATGFAVFVVWAAGHWAPSAAWSADDQSTSVNFASDVAPIFSEKCLRCHQSEREEGDFRIDDPAQLSAMVVAGSLEDSQLWAEHLAEGASNPMPPEDENDSLSAQQLATIKLWIESGAKFEAVEDWRAVKPSEQRVAAAEDVATVLWIIAGRLHPALLHFPVALLSVAALFAVFAFGNKHMDKAAMYCLCLGSLGACAAAVSGWGFAEHKQWPALETEVLGSQPSLHRWGGVAVAALGLFVFVLAYISRLNPDRSQLWWKLGVVVVAGLVGFVGHLGGKLTHDDLYTKPLERLRTLLFESPSPADALNNPAPEQPEAKAVPATSDSPNGATEAKDDEAPPDAVTDPKAADLQTAEQGDAATDGQKDGGTGDGEPTTAESADGG